MNNTFKVSFFFMSNNKLHSISVKKILEIMFISSPKISVCKSLKYTFHLRAISEILHFASDFELFKEKKGIFRTMFKIPEKPCLKK